MFASLLGRNSTGPGVPPVVARTNAVGPEHLKLWADIEAAMVQTLQVIRSGSTTPLNQHQQQAAGAIIFTQMGWHAKVYKAVTTTGVAAEFIYQKFRAFVELDLKVNVCNPLMQMFRDATTASSVGGGTEKSGGGVSGGDSALFAATAKYYQQFCVFRRFARIVLQYIDQFYTARHAKSSIPLVMNALFYNIVYVRVKDVLAAVALRRVNAHRRGEHVDMSALRGAILLFAEISVAVSPSKMDPFGAATCAISPASSTSAPTVAGGEQTDRFRLDFLDKYVEETRSFYRGSASRQMQQPTGPQTFVQWFEERMLLEEKLVQDLLPAALWHDVEQALHRAIIDPHVVSILQHPMAGVRVLIQEGRSDALKHLYGMAVHHKEGCKLMASELQVAVEQGIASVFADYDATLLASKTEGEDTTTAKRLGGGPEPTKAMEVSLVVALVGVWEQYRALIGTNMGSDRHIFNGLSAAFQTAFNPVAPRDVAAATSEQQERQEGRCSAVSNLSSIFSSYLDMLCRRELTETFDADTETQRVEVLVVLVMFLQDRDVFQESFRARLAKRLLQTTPALDVEHLVLEKLQRSLGKTFTFRMEAMLRDHEHTGDLQRAFDQQRAAKQQQVVGGDEVGAVVDEADISVQVLTASHWPAYRCDEMTPPRSLEAGMRSFRFFYTKKHASRTLSWVHALGSSQLQVLFPKGTKDITCSIFQASILLVVAESSKQQCSVAALAAALSLSLNLIKMQVASMYLHKVYNLLSLCDADGSPCPPARTIHDGDMLTLNPAFAHKLRKFKLAAPVAARRDGEPTKPEMEALRRAQTDAAIVRVMKSRRRIAYNELHDQAIHQLSKLFVPSAHFFKQRLEDLIARAYIRRDETNRSVLEYIA